MIPQFSWGDRRLRTPAIPPVLVKTHSAPAAPVQIYYGFLPDSPISLRAVLSKVPVHQLPYTRRHLRPLCVNARCLRWRKRLSILSVYSFA